MFIRKSVFDALGGFDEDFFAHQEEIDLCWRLHHLGKRIVFCPKTVVYHVGAATLPTESAQKTYLNFRNSLFMLLKNLPSKSLIWLLFFRLCLDGVAGIRYFLLGQFSFTWAIVKAHFDFYKKFNYFRKKRFSTQFSNYYNVKSIVWEYFIKDKKYFSNI